MEENLPTRTITYMKHLLGNTKFERKPSGAIMLDGIEVAHTLQCCHCGGHYVSVKGSGKRRGFCMKCMGVTCGSVKCDNCIPTEKMLDNIEKGL